MDYIIYYTISGFVFGFVCNAILKDKGYGTDENPNYGFWWGFVFSVLGLVVCVCKKRLENIQIETKNKPRIIQNDKSKSYLLSVSLYISFIFLCIFILWIAVMKF